MLTHNPLQQPVPESRKIVCASSTCLARNKALVRKWRAEKNKCQRSTLYQFNSIHFYILTRLVRIDFNGLDNVDGKNESVVIDGHTKAGQMTGIAK